MSEENKPVKVTKVIAYKLDWSVGLSRGRITLIFDGGSTKQLDPMPAEEFNATVNVLRESPIAWYDNQVLSTGWEPVADHELG